MRVIKKKQQIHDNLLEFLCHTSIDLYSNISANPGQTLRISKGFLKKFKGE
jgi:hypothetical protein